MGDPFLTSYHATLDVPVLGAKMEFALAQLFDFGIFLLVAGGVMTAVLALAGDGSDEAQGPPLVEEESAAMTEESEDAGDEAESASEETSELGSQEESVDAVSSVEGKK